ncbi:extracellular solute-binding protein [Actinoplanes sp. NPDC024001]|uniref:extracellular solute-binding protein n=1 Tax=Actinoplanes sp. NPDC024001 TaxID=3154598 RepID=UPI0033FCD886
MRNPNRRSFLGLVGLGAASVAGGGLLSGCSKDPKGAASATNAEQAAGVIPHHKPLELVPPDIKGVRPVADGYAKYPANLVDAVTEKVGKTGKPISATVPWWGPVPPTAGNKLIEAINADLGVTINFSVQDGVTYGDKLNAMVGARDVPDLLCIPGWEINKLARFSEGVHVLFEDLTPYLAGDKVSAYPLLANLDTASWQDSIWGGKLMAIPFPTDSPFVSALFYRKDLTDKAGLEAPTTIDGLYEFGKKLNNPGKVVWAFGDPFGEVQQILGTPGSPNAQAGWARTADGKVIHRYETEQFQQAVEFTARLFKEGMIHPDLVGSKGGDAKTLFKGGKIIAYPDGLGAWRGMQKDTLKVVPGFNMQPMKVHGATAGAPPVRWGGTASIIWTFVKKGQGAERVEELLRVLNYTAAPFGTKEYELQNYGVEGTHFTRDSSNAPITNDVFTKEFASQFVFLGGRPPVIVGGPDVGNYAADMIAWANEAVPFLEKNPWQGIKVEVPSKQAAMEKPTEDKINDILRGRRPVSDVSKVVTEWRNGGGDEAREFYAKVLSDNGR